MSNIADVKIWARDDLLRVVTSIYVTKMSANAAQMPREERAGFVSGLASFALFVGIKPADFLSPADMKLIQERLR